MSYLEFPNCGNLPHQQSDMVETLLRQKILLFFNIFKIFLKISFKFFQKKFNFEKKKLIFFFQKFENSAIMGWLAIPGQHREHARELP